jgi:hypothetical protein
MKKIILVAFAFGALMSAEVFAGCPTGGTDGHTKGSDCTASSGAIKWAGHWHCKTTGWVCE